MKKFLSMVLGLVLIFSFTACSTTAPTTGTEGTQPESAIDIGYSVPDTTNPFLGWLTTEVAKLAEADGKKVQIADAGNSSAKQIEQIENFIAMKVKVIDIMPIDPNNVQDVIKKAQAAGIKVLVAGTDTGVYDVMMNMDQYNAGEQIAEMAIDWIGKTFPADQKVKVLVLKCTETVDMTNRSKGITDKINAWGKAEVVVATAEARTTAAATAVLENMWQQNSDAVAVLCYNADGAIGVNEYIMGQSKVDRAKFGVFAGDWSPPIQEVLDSSLKNESVFRGTMQIVGPKINNEQVPLEIATYRIMKGLAEGTYDLGKIIQDSIAKASGLSK